MSWALCLWTLNLYLTSSEHNHLTPSLRHSINGHVINCGSETLPMWSFTLSMVMLLFAFSVEQGLGTVCMVTPVSLLSSFLAWVFVLSSAFQVCFWRDKVHFPVCWRGKKSTSKWYIAEETDFYRMSLYLEENPNHSIYLRHLTFCLRKMYSQDACKSFPLLWEMHTDCMCRHFGTSWFISSEINSLQCRGICSRRYLKRFSNSLEARNPVFL